MAALSSVVECCFVLLLFIYYLFYYKYNNFLCCINTQCYYTQYSLNVINQIKSIPYLVLYGTHSRLYSFVFFFSLTLTLYLTLTRVDPNPNTNSSFPQALSATHPPPRPNSLTHIARSTQAYMRTRAAARELPRRTRCSVTRRPCWVTATCVAHATLPMLCASK